MTLAIAAAALVLSAGALAARAIGPFGWVVAASGGIVALAVPLGYSFEIRRRAWLMATGAGVLAVVSVRLLAPLPMSATRWGLAAAVMTGVAEEAIFRRGLYGLLVRWGPAVAIVSSAGAFALVHIPVYGWRVLPLNIAAGLVFGWQRWAGGHWSSPAATHALANALAHI
ncbi:MAG: CPBP family intramembrane glutamic endopeptidase [Actinomycetota bacterium]